ncbi:aspartyl protease family protein [Cedecea sp. NFIX57]|uniref:aspartyl protease family protein n=1 Tax=Cedecea sp. NFIX57 TaxID=1566286 RepID=UPI000A0B86DD|nr:aspartyl protease family protein [Cedecea sp. NFIX57]SMG12989.1 Aspartyl protease [Cedecea sp. NFIX57]
MVKCLPLLMLFFSDVCIASAPADFWRLRYDERGLPLADVRINNRFHTLMLDTGSGEGLHLYKHNLYTLIANIGLKITQKAPRRMIDVSGGESTSPSWNIHELTISDVQFDDVEAVELKPWGFNLGGDVPTNEVMGLGVFHDRRVLIDFKNHRLQMLDSLPSEVNKWSSYPIKQTESGLRVTAFAGITPLHLIVDTGASHSLLFSDRLPANTLFSGCKTLEPEASNLDCRVAELSITDNEGKTSNNLAIVSSSPTPQEIDFDGLLGMNFMRERQVILDMIEGRLYINP